MELNQKLHKSMPRRCWIKGIYTREKYLITWALKREEGICSKGVYFREITVIFFMRETTYKVILSMLSSPSAINHVQQH